MAANGIHHLGVAVEDLDEAIAAYERIFGAELEGRETQEEPGVLAALGPETPVGRFLARRGPGMHHVAYEVDDLSAELARLAGDGVELIDAAPRPGLFGTQVAFVHPAADYGVLSELVAARA